MSLRRDGLLLSMCACIGMAGVNSYAQVSVTTYHYDHYRTGWNSHETILTPAAVKSSSFGMLETVTVDDQVDAQPLYVANETITAGSYPGKHNVVYIATENNTIYAIDADSGTVLLNPNFGPPVPNPLGCKNNGPNVGVTSTPVIDPTANTMYAVFYTNDTTGPTYRIHALDLGSLTDKVTPQVVAASHTLNDGTAFNFNAKYQRQRPALLLANGSVYAGFGSFCDYSPNMSRGWLLGWETNSLTPLSANRLNDTQATSPNSFFLSSIWMSGFGLAADTSGNILFVTGNSDYSGTTYDGISDIEESVIKVSSDLTTLVDLFTPDNESYLDQNDDDFGAGGVMVLPNQRGKTAHMAVAAGKFGTMYLMNEDKLGGYSPLTNNVLGSYQVGACWCGESYFTDSKGVAHIVSSGGRSLEVWNLKLWPGASLTETKSAAIGGGQDGGFFTTISSNGTATPVIWAISRPTYGSGPIYLYAFNPATSGSSMTMLFSGVAGSWAVMSANANLVPVVANGKVFVASNKQLQIFGLKGRGTAP